MSTSSKAQETPAEEAGKPDPKLEQSVQVEQLADGVPETDPGPPGG